MKELVINGNFTTRRVTGVERYAREILKRFDECGYAYRLLAPSSLYSYNKLTHHFWEQVILPLNQRKESVLWSPNNSGPIRANDHVITLHDAVVFEHPEWFSSSYVRWRKALVPNIVKRVRAIITVSEFSKTVICKHHDIAPENVHVVYNGVDTDRFKPSDKESIKQVMNRYGISTPYVLSLGSLDPRKNTARLVEAWNQIDEGGPAGFTLAIAGGGNANFKRFTINSSPSVKLLGYVDDKDLPALYAGATGFVFPSLFEGFGLPVVEAMACGTPVITSDSTALAEIAGDAAIKVSPESAESIREGLLQLLESGNIRNTLAEKGLERVRLFDWNKSAAAIYRHLIN